MYFCIRLVRFIYSTQIIYYKQINNQNITYYVRKNIFES